MEIVIENPTDAGSSLSPPPPSSLPQTTTSTLLLPQSSSSLTSLSSPSSTSPSNHPQNHYYGTLPMRKRPQLIKQQQQHDFDLSTSVRRVDKSGLLEIPEPEPQRSTRPTTHLIDRMCQLEAVPEVPDHIYSQSPELNKLTRCNSDNLRLTRSIIERHLTGAEIDNNNKIDNKQYQNTITLSPNLSIQKQQKLLTEQTNNFIHHHHHQQQHNNHNHNHGQQTIKKFDCNNKNLMDIDDIKYKNISTKYLPIDTIGNNSRQSSYVDLTGATYTKSTGNNLSSSSSSSKVTLSNNCDDIIDKQKQSPDCLSKYSPKSINDNKKIIQTSSIPDVIEAHGSKVVNCDNNGNDNDDNKNIPRGERAEAEGCEHTAIESSEEARVSFKASNKLLHNDNIQTLRVIILSEQL